MTGHLKFGDNIETASFATVGDLEREHTHLSREDTRDDNATRGARRCQRIRDRAVEVLDAESRRIHDKRRYLLRKPRALQYFRGHTLIRSDEERGASRLELFFDLVLVGLCGSLGEEVASDPTGPSLVRFILTFGGAFLIWSWMREVFNAFYKDDLAQRILVVFVMACLAIFGNNAISAELTSTEGGNARATTIGAYLIGEAAIFANFFFYGACHIKAFRIQLLSHVAIWICTSAIWIGAIFVSDRAAIAMAAVALFLEYMGWFIVYSPPFKRLLKLTYSSATNIEHEIERHGDFVTLVTGEFVTSTFRNQPAGIGFHDNAGRAVMSLLLAWVFQLLYINGGGSIKIVHPIRNSVYTVMVYFFIHFPIVAALTMCGDGMGEMIRDQHAPVGLRWLVCETYAVAMLSLWILAWTEKEEDAKGMLWMPKWLRILPRWIATIVAVFLPFTYQNPTKLKEESEKIYSPFQTPFRRAHEIMGGLTTIQGPADDIDTTKLLGILTALSSFVLLWELIGGLDGPNAPHESAPEHLISLAADATQGDGHTTTACLQTPKWKGFPTLVEPGTFSFDYSRQRGPTPMADATEENRQEDLYHEATDDLHRHPSGTHLHPSQPNQYSDGPEDPSSSPEDPPKQASEDEGQTLDSGSGSVNQQPIGEPVGKHGSVHVGKNKTVHDRPEI